MPVTFSPVTPDQAETLQRLAHATFIAAYSGQIDEAEMHDYLNQTHSIAKLSEELADPEVRYYFVLQGQQPAGFAMLRHNRSHPELGDDKATLLNRIYLLPEYWGAGIARSIMEFCEDLARRNGARWLWLQVWQENRRAIRFYEKCGFAHFGFMDFHLGDVVHSDWVMRKDLEANPMNYK